MKTRMIQGAPSRAVRRREIMSDFLVKNICPEVDHCRSLVRTGLVASS